MKTFITSDGERFEVSTARDLVRAMRNRSPTPGSNQAEWMAGVKRRAFQETRRNIDISSEATFVASLLDIGLLREENGQ